MWLSFFDFRFTLMQWIRKYWAKSIRFKSEWLKKKWVVRTVLPRFKIKKKRVFIRDDVFFELYYGSMQGSLNKTLIFWVAEWRWSNTTVLSLFISDRFCCYKTKSIDYHSLYDLSNKLNEFFLMWICWLSLVIVQQERCSDDEVLQRQRESVLASVRQLRKAKNYEEK